MSTSSGVIWDIICAEWRNSSASKKDKKIYETHNTGLDDKLINTILEIEVVYCSKGWLDKGVEISGGLF